MENLDIFKKDIIALLNSFDISNISATNAKKTGRTNNLYIKDDILKIETWKEANIICSNLVSGIWEIYRVKYGRDRKNDGEGLKQKVEPFLLKFRNLSSRVQELRIEEMKQNGTYSF